MAGERGAASFRFTMEFQPTTIEHLGARLYSRLAPVIAELVSNAYDAESPKVEIQVPTGPITPQSTITLRDYGHGLNATEIQEEYLPISRFRRGQDAQNVMSKNGIRRVTGRKGIGKLSAFGIAREMDVRAIKGQRAICLRLDYDEIQKWVSTRGSGPYEPTVIADRTGQTDEPDGVEVTLRKLIRKAPIDPSDLRRQLARRLDLIDPRHDFRVLVNGTEIGIDDKIQRSECAEGLSWDVADIPGGGNVAGDEVRGWIGFLPRSSQVDRGVNIMANGKAVELDSYFNFPSTDVQFARAYLVGVVHVDFLDAQYDLASTARNSVVWEHELGQGLENWGQGALRWAFDKWLANRREKKERETLQHAGFDLWLDARGEPEKRVARRMLDIIVNDPNIDPESAEPLLEIVKSSVESRYFYDLVDRLEREGQTSVSTLLRLFDEWKVIEARELMKRADGRLAAIEQLEEYILNGALEVQQMQKLFREHPWLLDHGWQQADFEQSYTRLLEKHCTEPKETPEIDRRVDIFGMRSSGTATIVEIKRPEKRLSWDDLNQVERYVAWGRSNLVGTGPGSARMINGLLVVGTLSDQSEVGVKLNTLAGQDIRVQTYSDLHRTASEIYGIFRQRLQDVAPEHTREARKQRSS